MAEKVLRVLHVVGTSDVGGTERFLVDLASRHNRRGIASSICVLDAPGALAAEYERVAVRVDHLELRRDPLHALGRWRSVVSSIGPDLIVLYGARANALGRLVPVGRTRIPIIAALRSTVLDEGGRMLVRRVDRLTFNRVTAAVSNSRAAVSLLLSRGYPEDRLTYVPPGVDWRAVEAPERTAARLAFGVGDVPIILSVANLKPVKQHTVLLEACGRLLAMGVRHRLWLVGDGPERQRLERMAQDLKLDVLFAGHESDPRSRYAAADVFALSSAWEGTPMSILEAMASGLPVVAGRVGDIPSIVRDGLTGRLVDGRDPSDYAGALREALEPAQNRAWGDAARIRASEFSADVAADRYERIFRWATDPRGKPVPVFVEVARPTRILRVLSRLNVGGPTLHVVLLTQAFNNDAFTTRLIAGSVGQNEGDMSYVAADRRVAVESIPELGRSVAPLRDCLALIKLMRSILSFQPHIVHTHASKAGALGRTAATLYNATRRRPRRSLIIHTYHGHTFEGYFGRRAALVFRFVERVLGRVTDTVVVLANSQRHDIVDRFHIVRSEQVRVVPLGLDLAPFFALGSADVARARGELGLTGADKGIVAAGRLTPVKNLGMLLRAFAHVADRRPHVHLFIVGDGELRTQLERQAQSLLIAQRVSFLGWRRDMASVYAACDVVALTSINEGTPVALIEGMAGGCRAVSTRVGGVAAVVDPSCGILVEAGMEQSFSKALETALDGGRLNDEQRLRMRRFSLNRLVADLTDLYSERLELRRSRRTKDTRP